MAKVRIFQKWGKTLKLCLLNVFPYEIFFLTLHMWECLWYTTCFEFIDTKYLIVLLVVCDIQPFSFHSLLYLAYGTTKCPRISIKNDGIFYYFQCTHVRDSYLHISYLKSCTKLFSDIQQVKTLISGAILRWFPWGSVYFQEVHPIRP